jgi:lipoprotein NlpI
MNTSFFSKVFGIIKIILTGGVAQVIEDLSRKCEAEFKPQHHQKEVILNILKQILARHLLKFPNKQQKQYTRAFTFLPAKL